MRIAFPPSMIVYTVDTLNCSFMFIGLFKMSLTVVFIFPSFTSPTLYWSSALFYTFEILNLS